MRRAAASLLLLLLCTGCGVFYSGPQQQFTVDDHDAYLLGVVELDDQGWFVDRAKVKEVLDAVESAAAENGATIVVYVHGWHHNARSSNLEGFRETLARLDELLQNEVYRQARLAIIPKARNRIVGVYVGWRGRALPGRLPVTLWTFWNRRAAATRVGNGDVPELMLRLHRIYERYNTPEPGKPRAYGAQADPVADRRFTGMVIVGHSFGGQVVYASVADVMKQRITPSVAVTSVQNRERIDEPITGFGDLVVLVNPALEASVYQSFDDLLRDKQFHPRQMPVMMILSSEADRANRYAFTAGRRVAVVQEPRGRPGQFEMKTHSIGHVRSQVTHCLRLWKDLPCQDFQSFPVAPEELTREIPDAELPKVIEQHRQQGTLCAFYDELAGVRLGGQVHLYDDRFRLERVDRGLDLHLPFLVARTKASIIGGHSDVFNGWLREFLVRYVALEQAKRVAPLLRDECLRNN